MTRVYLGFAVLLFVGALLCGAGVGAGLVWLGWGAAQALRG